MTGTLNTLIKKHKRKMRVIKNEIKKRGWSIGNKALAIRIRKFLNNE